MFDINKKYCSSGMVIYRECFNLIIILYLIILYQSFPNMHWHFPCCKYLSVTRIKIQIMDTEIKIVTKKELRLIGKKIAQTLGIVLGFLWKLKNLNRLFGWVFERHGRLFWVFEHRKTLIIFLNLVCKKHTYTPTYILWKPRTLSRASYIYFLVRNVSFSLILLNLSLFLLFFRY